MTGTVEGFTNYATFAVGVVVDNDQGMHDHVRNYVMELESASLEDYEIADRLKEYYEESMPELEGFWSSLLRAGWEEIDWLDLATHWADPEWRETLR